MKAFILSHQNKKALSPFSIKNIFYDETDFRLFYFDVTISSIARRRENALCEECLDLDVFLVRFSRIRTECWNFTYSVRVRENTHQKNPNSDIFETVILDLVFISTENLYENLQTNDLK